MLEVRRSVEPHLQPPPTQLTAAPAEGGSTRGAIPRWLVTSVRPPGPAPRGATSRRRSPRPRTGFYRRAKCPSRRAQRRPGNFDARARDGRSRKRCAGAARSAPPTTGGEGGDPLPERQGGGPPRDLPTRPVQQCEPVDLQSFFARSNVHCAERPARPGSSASGAAIGSGQPPTSSSPEYPRLSRWPLQRVLLLVLWGTRCAPARSSGQLLQAFWW